MSHYISTFESFLNENEDEDGEFLSEAAKRRETAIVMKEQEMSSKSLNRKISSLKSYFKFLLKIKQIKVNPLLKHKSLKTAKKIQIPFSEKELQDVFEFNSYSNDFEGMRNQLIIELFLY
jgi:integrase/recombinase XerC